MFMDQKLLFKELEESTQTGCWSYDLETEQLTWSEYTYRIHGIEPGTIIHVNEAMNFYHEEDREQIIEGFENCVATGAPYRMQLRIIDKLGRIVFVESTGKAIYDDKKIVKVFGTFRDISVEAKLKERSKNLENKYTHLTNLLNDYFIVAETDTKGIITYANEHFCNISKYKYSELVGADHRILNSGLHDKKFFEDMWKTIKAGSAWEGLICNKAKDGSLYWVRTFIFPKFRNEEISGYMAIRLDVTEEIEILDELDEERKRTELAAQLAAVGEMSAGIAHEINNPLTVVMGKLAFMRKCLDDKERCVKFIDDIERSAFRIAKIVKGLHYLSQKSREEEHTVVDLHNVLDYTFEFCREALKNKGIALSLEESGEKISVKCDEVKISQIFLNLINNARDSITEASSDEKWIKLKVGKIEKQVYVDVLDSGPDIPSDIKEKIIEPFFTTKEVGKGTGLGLSIVTRFLKEHDGALVILEDEKVGKGFRVLLPAA